MLDKKQEDFLSQKEDYCEQFQEKSLLGFCGQHNGDLTFNKLYPTPNNKEYINCELEVKNECNLSISIYNIAGRHITTSKTNYSAAIGTNEISFNFDGKVKKGYYIFVVESDKWDRVFMNFLRSE